MMVTPQERCEPTLAIPGRHNVANALAAAAGTRPWAHRLRPSRRAGADGAGQGPFLRATLGWPHLVDDTYNASVESVLAGIDALTAMNGYKVLVFGDMKELGEESAAQHARSDTTPVSRASMVLTVEQSRHTADAAAGRHFDNKASLF